MDEEEELFEAWPLCGGWFSEILTLGNDLMSGRIQRSSEFRYSPICSYSSHDIVDHVSERFWIALVTMFGVQTEEGGEISYDPDSVKPVRIKKEFIEFRGISEEYSNHVRNIMSYIAGYNNFTWENTQPELPDEEYPGAPE
tara:strand:- start:99 stop:521 length:423 start_codon:yes stop_codon:yes gene_type:complete